MTARSRAYLLSVAVAAVWGIAAPIVKYAFASFPPAIFLSYRFFITCLALLPVLVLVEPHLIPHLRHLTPRDWLVLALSGFLGSTVQLGIFFWGLDHTTSLDASFISTTSPILVALAGHYFLKEHISHRERTGLFIAFLGSLIIVAQPLLQGQSLFSGNLFGNLLILAAMLLWVVYVVLTKQEIRHHVTPLQLTFSMFFIGFITLTTFVILRYRPAQLTHIFTTATTGAHLSVFYMAIFSGAFAYWAYQKAQKTIEVSEANLFHYLSPLFAVPLAFFWLKEPLTLPFVVGAAVITTGVILAQLRR